MRFLHFLILVLVPLTTVPALPVAAQEESWILHTYEVKFRLDGQISTTQVQASDAGQAKKLVQAQFGQKVTVLSTKRVK